MILEYDIGCLLVLLTLLQVLKTILDLSPIAPDVQPVTHKSRVVFSIGQRLFGEKVSYKVEKTH